MHYSIKWEDPEPSGTAATATRGCLEVVVRGSVWPDLPSWPWVELLEYLATYYRCIAFENERDEPPVMDVDGSLEFLLAHDLGMGLSGIVSDRFLVVRSYEKDTALVSLEDGEELVPWSEVRSLLLGIAADISARLEPLEDPRAKDVVKRWQKVVG